MRRSSQVALAALFLVVVGGGLACNAESPTGAIPPAEVRVLFVGNSLTEFNDLPALVRTVAEAAGHTLEYEAVLAGGQSLEDHWHSGVAGYIRRAGADVVVMQQGPSSLPDNQVHLREWSDTLARVIREVGGRPALFMVWPSRPRFSAFPAVRDSYRGAAEAVGGIFAPAGQAWLETWERDPDAELYGPDDFHPSFLGSLVAALTIYRMLYGEPVTDLPARLEPASPGLSTVELDPATAAVVYAAVEAAVAEWGLP